VQKSGKTVHAWAFAGDWDERTPIVSNTFEMEWPPRSGKNSNSLKLIGLSSSLSLRHWRK